MTFKIGDLIEFVDKEESQRVLIDPYDIHALEEVKKIAIILEIKLFHLESCAWNNVEKISHFNWHDYFKVWLTRENKQIIITRNNAKNLRLIERKN